jgi:Tfp pilus assembly protein PilO
MIKQAIEILKMQLGWQGISGIVLLAIAAGFQFMSLEPLEQEATYLRGRLDTTHAKASAQGRNHSLGGRQNELASFYDSLPDEKNVTDILAMIYSTAETSGLQFKEAAYHLEEKNKHLTEYTVTFPVTGEYGKIRVFVSRVLASYPAIALDQIDFQRDRISDTMLKANIRMTMFLKPFAKD